MHEDIFILNAARVHLSEKNIQILNEILDNGVDWNTIYKKASVHNVTTFIYYSLTKHGLAGNVPPDVYKKFQADYYETAVRNSMLIDELARLSSIIGEKFISLKGTHLVQELYPTFGVRSMCDIDILVEKKHVRQIWSRLQNHGYKDSLPIQIEHFGFQYTPAIQEQIFKSKVHSKIYDRRLPYHLSPLISGKVSLDVHWNIFQKDKFYPVTEKVWQSAVFLKDNMYVLSNEMLLVHLCSHFYKHFNNNCTSLRALCDINEFMYKYADALNWNEVKDVTQKAGLFNQVTEPLTCAYLLLGTDVPEAFISNKLFLNKNITLDLLSVVKVEQRRSPLLCHLSMLKKIYNPVEFIELVFRTVVPVKEWVRCIYKVSNSEKLWKAYFKYWKYLIDKHLLFRQVNLGR